MKFLHPNRDEELELATDDVFLTPAHFEGSSRLETDLTPTDFLGGSHPIVSANMNAVTGKRMAETMARFGGPRRLQAIGRARRTARCGGSACACSSASCS